MLNKNEIKINNEVEELVVDMLLNKYGEQLTRCWVIYRDGFWGNEITIEIKTDELPTSIECWYNMDNNEIKFQTSAIGTTSFDDITKIYEAQKSLNDLVKTVEVK